MWSVRGLGRAICGAGVWRWGGGVRRGMGVCRVRLVRRRSREGMKGLEALFVLRGVGEGEVG